MNDGLMWSVAVLRGDDADVGGARWSAREFWSLRVFDRAGRT